MESLRIALGTESRIFETGETMTDEAILYLARAINNLNDQIEEFKKNASMPEGTRMNILEYSHDNLWKTQMKSNTTLEEIRAEIARMSRKFDHDHKAHTRIYKEIDAQGKAIVTMDEKDFQRTETDIKRDKRISDIEEFLGDL